MMGGINSACLLNLYKTAREQKRKIQNIHKTSKKKKEFKQKDVHISLMSKGNKKINTHGMAGLNSFESCNDIFKNGMGETRQIIFFLLMVALVGITHNDNIIKEFFFAVVYQAVFYLHPNVVVPNRISNAEKALSGVRHLNRESK